MPFDSHRSCPEKGFPGDEPLICYAARWDDLPRVMELVEAGFPTDARDSQGKTALQIATELGNTKIVEYLTNK